jgi:hypothetical protein
MNAVQIGQDYHAPIRGYANGSRTFKLKLGALRLGVRIIFASEVPLEWFAFCPAPEGIRGFSIYLRRVGLGWRWQR